MHRHVLQPIMLCAANMPQIEVAHCEHGSRLRRRDVIDHRRERARQCVVRNLNTGAAQVLPSLAAATAGTALRLVLGRHMWQTSNTAA